MYIKNRATARLFCNDISSNQETGVVVTNSSNAVLTDNTLSENGQRRIDDPNVFFDAGLSVGDGSSVDSRGNTYTDNQYSAISVSRSGTFVGGDFLPREPGHPADPNGRDVITERGCDPATGTGCFTSDASPLAVEVFNGGLFQVRNAEINGEAEVVVLSSFRIGGESTMQGNITNGRFSLVKIRNLFPELGDRTVSYTGTLECFGDSKTWGGSSVSCNQICDAPGDIPGDCRKPQCSDGLDNDGDGQIDLADPQCSGILDDDEFS